MPAACLGEIYLGPADMRHRQSTGEPANPARQQTQPTGLGSLLAGLEEELQPQADAEHRRSGLRGLLDGLPQPAGSQGAGALPEVAHTG
jgi:hypothetical protein